MNELIAKPAAITGNVLIVDDEPSARATLAALLEDATYNLAFAANGREALSIAPTFDPDVILLDVMMPGQDGFETCQQLRAHPQLAEVPILMVTALDDRLSKLRALEAGADDFLTKPLDRLELMTRLRAITRLNRHRRLQEERAKFERLVNLSPDGVLLVDAEGAVRFANLAMRTMLGLKANAALADKKIFDLVAPEQLHHCRQCFAGVINHSATALRVETLFVRNEGAQFPVEINAGRMTWEGQPAVQLVVRDVTEQKQMEAELFRAQRIESIGLLAGGIAHDLNNILAPIFIASELLKPNQPDDESVKMLGIVNSSAERAAALVRQVLTFARGSGNGHGELPLKSLIGEVHGFVRQAFPKLIQCDCLCDDDLHAVCGDATQLYQLLLNLCVNARDAMPDGGRLRIEARNHPCSENGRNDLAELGAGNYVVLTIADSGTGIPPEILNHIFEPLFTTKPEGQGTGLGLATVMRIVNNHRGIIKVTSQPGAGTAFTIYLPVADQPQTATGPQPLVADVPAGKGELILVVDDEAAIREITRQSLESLNYTVETATDGLDALLKFGHHRESIRAVITDVSMPYHSGLTLLDAMRRFDPHLPVIVASGMSDTTEIRRHCTANNAVFVPKPFTVSEIARMLRSALEVQPESSASKNFNHNKS